MNAISKIVMVISLLGLIAVGAMAQGYTVRKKDGTHLKYAKGEVKDITLYGFDGSRPDMSPAKAVDLGLSVKWASCNVGATTPEEAGGMYSWGETEEKSVYDWTTYKYCNGTQESITAYYVDDVKTLKLEDDVAYVKWGGSWRMPTYYELYELKQCSWEKVTLSNGMPGYIVTGPNGNSICLPCNGQRYNDKAYSTGNAFYWSSSIFSAQYAPAIYKTSDELGFMNYARSYGFSVRPVKDKNKLVAPWGDVEKGVAINLKNGTTVCIPENELDYVAATDDDDPRLDDVVPESMRENLKDYMPIYSGVTPPNIEGTYVIEPYVTVKCQDEGNGGYYPGDVIPTYKIRFSNQNATNNTIDMDEYRTDNYDSNTGNGSFISGSDNYFTAFFNTEGVSLGVPNKMAVVISGKKTDEGIKDLYYGLVMVEKGSDPSGKLMKVGYYRVFKDGNGLSEPSIWDLPANSRSEANSHYDIRMVMNSAKK